MPIFFSKLHILQTTDWIEFIFGKRGVHAVPNTSQDILPIVLVKQLFYNWKTTGPIETDFKRYFLLTTDRMSVSYFGRLYMRFCVYILSFKMWFFVYFVLKR